MSYIEDLRRQREAEEAKATRAAAEEKAKSDAYWKPILEESERRRAENNARRVALERSAVRSVIQEIGQADPKLLHGTADAPQGEREGTGFNTQVGPSTYESLGGYRVIVHQQLFKVEGQPDGSVLIGDRILSPTQAVDHDTVESALERAIKNPTEKITTEDHTPPDYGQSEHGTGWGMGGF